jgi:hypothetical protein
MQSKMHPYFNWATERLDEMDAALGSLEAKLGDVQLDARIRAGQILVELRERRDHFRNTVSKQTEAGEGALASAKAKLESEWSTFQAQVNQYVETFAKQVEQQRATFRLQADAQLKSWRATAAGLNGCAMEFAAERRNEVEENVKRMIADAAAAEEKLRKFGQAGTQSWSAMMTALTETRAAFDRANQAAADALEQAAR